jgi:uncharacterized membrane protein (DUF2068 family)
MSEEQKDLPMELPPGPKPRRAPTLYVIIGFKLLKGLMALLLAWGVSRLTDDNHDGMPDNLPAEFQKLLQLFHVDPEKKFIMELANRVAEITQNDLHWVVIFLVVYSLFMLLQAGGLIFRVSWIVWLVIGESAFFIPIEVFELVRKHAPAVENHPHIFAHPKIYVAILLVMNVAIVWYLFRNRDRIIRHHHH